MEDQDKINYNACPIIISNNKWILSKKIFILKQIKIHIKTLQHQAAACNCFDCKVTTKLSLTSKNCLWLHDDFETFRNITRIVKLPQWKFAFIVYSCDFCSTLWNLIDIVNFDRIYNRENSIVTFSSIHPHFYCGRQLWKGLISATTIPWGSTLGGVFTGLEIAKGRQCFIAFNQRKR